MGTLTVLLVDDDPVVRTLLQRRLLTAGYSVTTASDGVKATKIMKEEQFDVIITDLIMPGGIDGIDLLQQIKQQWCSTEVILITGHGAIGKAVEAMQKGAADYLEKPINIEELFLRLDKINQLKSLVKNAGDLREAMDTTIQSAADTIKNLELITFDQSKKLDKINKILLDNKKNDQTKLLFISNTLKS